MQFCQSFFFLTLIFATPMLFLGLAESLQASGAPRRLGEFRYTPISDPTSHGTGSDSAVVSEFEHLIDPPAQLNGHFEVRQLTPSPHDSEDSPYPDEANEINRYI